jgi:hypothetical protein
MTGISSLLVAGLVVGNIEYATHTYRYDSKVQAMAANNKVVEQTASFASSKKKSTVSKENRKQPVERTCRFDGADRGTQTLYPYHK